MTTDADILRLWRMGYDTWVIARMACCHESVIYNRLSLIRNSA